MTRFVLAAVLALIALNAFGGGYYGMAGAEGVPIEWLAGSPFRTYFIPSLILFVIVGGAFAVAAVAVSARWHHARLVAFAAAGVGVVWLATQLAIIGYVSWMQPATAAAIMLASLLTSRLRDHATTSGARAPARSV
jgi:hypothetical protein